MGSREKHDKCTDVHCVYTNRAYFLLITRVFANLRA